MYKCSFEPAHVVICNTIQYSVDEERPFHGSEELACITVPLPCTCLACRTAQPGCWELPPPDNQASIHYKHTHSVQVLFTAASQVCTARRTKPKQWNSVSNYNQLYCAAVLSSNISTTFSSFLSTVSHSNFAAFLLTVQDLVSRQALQHPVEITKSINDSLPEQVNENLQVGLTRPGSPEKLSLKQRWRWRSVLWEPGKLPVSYVLTGNLPAVSCSPCILPAI